MSDNSYDSEIEIAKLNMLSMALEANTKRAQQVLAKALSPKAQLEDQQRFQDQLNRIHAAGMAAYNAIMRI